MQDPAIDLLARALARRGPRRQAILAIGIASIAGVPAAAEAARRRKKNRKQRNKSKNKNRNKGKSKKGAFPRDCRRFVISAGPSEKDRFRHTDDDLKIILYSKKRNGGVKVLFDDDNDAPNGPNGDHLIVSPFTARVGDRIQIVARNEVSGGCELDEIWLHCIEGKGGKVKLTDRITPAECAPDANRVGVFFDETIRIRNKG